MISLFSLYGRTVDVITTIAEIEELRRKILAAFPKSVPLPPETLTEHRCEECDSLRDSFNGVEWWNTNNSLIDEHYDCLPLFSIEAFHYYLPAFLIRSIDSFDPNDEVLEFLVYGLSPTKTLVNDPRYSARLSLFTQKQLSVVANFLELIEKDERFCKHSADVERGLRKFWRVTKNEDPTN